MPGPIAMINGVIKGMAETHIGKMPEDYLQNTLTYIIAELITWRDGPATKGITDDGKQEPSTDLSTIQENNQ